MDEQTTLLCKQRQNLWLSLGVGLVLVGAVYFLLGMWPFGDLTMMTGDLGGLYVAYLTDLKNRLAQGGLFYSFSKLCGGSTLGLFSYYMCSPFNLLILLLPTRMIPVAVQLMFGLRTALTATAFCFFVQKHCGSASRVLPFLSQGYGLCAFCVVYSQNIIWMDVVLLAPLMLWAVEHLVETGRHWALTWLTAACVLLNFYTAWSVCLFSVIYFFYFWAASGRGRSGLLPRLGQFAASGAVGAGMGAMLLYPALIEIEQSKGALFEMSFTLEPQFPLWQLPYQLFFGNFFWNDVVDGLPKLYCGVFCAVLVLLFFLAGSIPARQKLAALAVLAVLGVSFWLNGVDLIWHGFKEPVWFPYRYSFVGSLFLLLLAARALLAGRPKVWALAAAGGVGLVWLAGYALTAGQEFSVMKLAACGVLCLGTLACVWLLGMKKSLALAGALGLCALTAADLVGNTVLSLRKFENYTKSGFEQFYDQNGPVIQALRRQDSGLYRIEKDFFHTLNDPMLLDHWGISHYSSTKASTAKLMLEKLGYVNYSVYGWGSTLAADSLLGIRYLYTDGSRPVYAPYEPLELGTELAVYRNPDALPMAYVGSSQALAVDVEHSTDAFALQAEMLQALVPGSRPVLLPAEQPRFLEGERGITLSFKAPADGPCYLAIPELGLFLPADVRVNGQLLGEYFTGDSLGGVFPLGHFAKGQPVELWLGTEQDTPEYRAQFQVYGLDTAALAAVTEQLRAAAPTDLEMEQGGRIRATAQGTAQGDLLVLPVAYEDARHWKASCNGQPVQVEQVFYGMMGIRLQPGENRIEMEYHHPGMGVGLALSLVSAALAAVWYGWERRGRRKGAGAPSPA